MCSEIVSLFPSLYQHIFHANPPSGQFYQYSLSFIDLFIRKLPNFRFKKVQYTTNLTHKFYSRSILQRDTSVRRVHSSEVSVSFRRNGSRDDRRFRFCCALVRSTFFMPRTFFMSGLAPELFSLDVPQQRLSARRRAPPDNKRRA